MKQSNTRSSSLRCFHSTGCYGWQPSLEPLCKVLPRTGNFHYYLEPIWKKFCLSAIYRTWVAALLVGVGSCSRVATTGDQCDGVAALADILAVSVQQRKSLVAPAVFFAFYIAFGKVFLPAFAHLPGCFLIRHQFVRITRFHATVEHYGGGIAGVVTV